MKPPGLNPQGRNIFLITTPLQFILANLIKSEFNLETEFLIVTDPDIWLKQIDEAAKTLHINNYKKIFKPYDPYKRNKLRLLFKETVRYISILKLKKTLKRCDNVFIGLATSPINRPIVCDFERYNLVFFDDGAATIRFLRKREAGRRDITFPAGSLIHFYTKLYPRSIILDKIVYYTIYPGLHGAPEDEIIHLKSKLPSCLNRKKKQVYEVWFIGGPLVENGVISNNAYTEIINNILKFCRNSRNKFVYFAHRAERWIYKFSDIEIRRLSIPWELFYIKSDVIPKAIVSVISSVILNLAILTKPLCPLLYLDVKDVLRNDIVTEIQEYGKTFLGIQVIKLNELGKFIY